MNTITSSQTLEVAKQLIIQNSITPNDANCMDIIIEHLLPYGFIPTFINSKDVRNLWLIRKSSSSNSIDNENNSHIKTFVFAGHTDVVPTGPLNEWDSEPFTPSIRDGKLFGRGAADMKTSIAAFIIASQKFIQENPLNQHNIALLITSDEEGPATDGTVKVVEWLKNNNIKLDYCIVGEPTAVDTLGDTIKNGRRGSLSGNLVVRGIQGHIAYPHLAKNPIHLASKAISELCAVKWDEGNSYFQPTSFQISNLNAGTGANNVIPNTLSAQFNFRFSTESSVISLKERVENILKQYNLDFSLEWTLGGEPFLTDEGDLSKAMEYAIKKICNIQPELSTSGGTSDARFIAKICSQVVECGPPNGSIHKINENVEIKFIEPLMNIYYETLKKLLM